MSKTIAMGFERVSRIRTIMYHAKDKDDFGNTVEYCSVIDHRDIDVNREIEKYVRERKRVVLDTASGKEWQQK